MQVIHVAERNVILLKCLHKDCCDMMDSVLMVRVLSENVEKRR